MEDEWVDDLFRRRVRVPLWVRLVFLADDLWEWWQDNWDRITPWVMGIVGLGLAIVTFIV